MIDKIKEVVRRASELMVTDGFEISEKGGCENIVTSSDVAVQHYLCEHLKDLIPGAGFRCEEEDLDTGSDKSGWKWIIDPIDGTANYARAIPECAISVALEHDGEVVAGVVYAPRLGEMYAAEKGKGATCNGRPIHVSDKPFRQGIICTAMSTYHKEFATPCRDIMTDVFMQANDFRRFGSAAVELCFIAAGRADLYFEMRLMPWDYAAAGFILCEAGGCICNLSGEWPSLTRADITIAANSEASLEHLAGIVRKHVPEKPYDF